jgi:hypothetical protein
VDWLKRTEVDPRLAFALAFALHSKESESADWVQGYGASVLKKLEQILEPAGYKLTRKDGKLIVDLPSSTSLHVEKAVDWLKEQQASAVEPPQSPTPDLAPKP